MKFKFEAKTINYTLCKSLTYVIQSECTLAL